MHIGYYSIFLLLVFTTVTSFRRLKTFSSVSLSSSLRIPSLLQNSKFSYLNDKDQKSYLVNVIKQSTDSTKAAISSGIKLIELAFPENRKNDISVSESLDTNRQFVKEFAKNFNSYGKNLWIIFPDRKESFLAMKSWGDSLSFTVLGLESFTIENILTKSPKCIIVMNPGFNVEEWITIAKVYESSISIMNEVPLIMINGNLDRLRNGYYPSLFYPQLKAVTDSFYRKFISVYFLSPIAVSGDRLGAWLVKTYNNPWQILVKSKAGYESIAQYDREPKPQDAWNYAKKSFNSIWGTVF